MDRKQHLQWCKQRALEYCDRDDLQNAFVSMISDLGKHEETADHVGIKLGMQLSIGGMLLKDHQMRRFIEGFN